MSLHPQDFAFFADILKRESGLALTPDKAYLLESRLAPIARRREARDLESLATLLRQGRDRELLRDIVEAMTTAETSFFRDMRPFTVLKDDIIPSLTRRREASRRLNIWSAACASGQEVYSLAMLLQEHPLLIGWHVDILATDICAPILEKAKAGSYSQFEVQRGLPIHSLVRHFTKDGDHFVVKPALRDNIRFRQANLLDTPPGQGAFDIIFCRNVLIYFDPATKVDALRNLRCALAPDGVLFLGGAETVVGLSVDFQPLAGCAGAFTRT